MNTDAQKVLKEKILLLQKYIKMLGSYLSLSDEEINQNEDKRLAMERSFQLVVDEAIDINAILIYQLGGTIPDSSKSSFYEIVPLNIIDQQFAEGIAESAKVRNQITHDYGKLSMNELVISTRKYFEMYKTYAKILIEKFA